MKIKEIEIDNLIPYDKNNKIHDEEQINLIANSISQFGFNSPIVIDCHNIIIAGHARVEAAKKLNLNKVPCVVKEDLTEAQIKAYRIADNKLAEMSKWDSENLQLELEYLKEVDFNLSDFALDDLFINTREILNSEILPSELDGSICTLKIDFSQEEYSTVTEKLNEINNDFRIAIKSLLNV